MVTAIYVANRTPFKSPTADLVLVVVNVVRSEVQGALLIAVSVVAQATPPLLLEATSLAVVATSAVLTAVRDALKETDLLVVSATFGPVPGVAMRQDPLVLKAVAQAVILLAIKLQSRLLTLLLLIVGAAARFPPELRTS